MELEYIIIEQKADFALMKLNRGRANPLNHQFIQEIRMALNWLEDQKEIRGIILTGSPGFFSVGLDIIELYGYDENKISEFWLDWQEMVFELCAFSKVMIAAISGHSPAGGCVLAVSADYRYMVEGEKYRIGLNEVAVGITVPAYIFLPYAFWIGEKNAYQNLMTGRLLSSKEAYEMGLLDKICAPDELLLTAENQMKRVLKAPDIVLKGTKKNLRLQLLKQMRRDIDQRDVEKLKKHWFDPEARKKMGEIVQQLSQKR